VGVFGIAPSAPLTKTPCRDMEHQSRRKPLLRFHDGQNFSDHILDPHASGIYQQCIAGGLERRNGSRGIAGVTRFNFALKGCKCNA
jgi:hypothetical protein